MSCVCNQHVVGVGFPFGVAVAAWLARVCSICTCSDATFVLQSARHFTTSRLQMLPAVIAALQVTAVPLQAAAAAAVACLHVAGGGEHVVFSVCCMLVPHPFRMVRV
jgi:hypothetical protein